MKGFWVDEPASNSWIPESCCFLDMKLGLMFSEFSMIGLIGVGCGCAYSWLYFPIARPEVFCGSLTESFLSEFLAVFWFMLMFSDPRWESPPGLGWLIEFLLAEVVAIFQNRRLKKCLLLFYRTRGFNTARIIRAVSNPPRGRPSWRGFFFWLVSSFFSSWLRDRFRLHRRYRNYP